MYEAIRDRLHAAIAAGGPAAVLEAELTALDRRESVILGDPVDAPDLQAVADVELADVQAARRARHELLTRRYALGQERAAVLAAHDSTADELAGLAGELRAGLLGAGDPTVAAVLGALDGVVARSRAGRTEPPASRADDLNGAPAATADALAGLRAALDAARAELGGATTALRHAAEAVATVTDEAP